MYIFSVAQTNDNRLSIFRTYHWQSFTMRNVT